MKKKTETRNKAQQHFTVNGTITTILVSDIAKSGHFVVERVTQEF